MSIKRSTFILFLSVVCLSLLACGNGGSEEKEPQNKTSQNTSEPEEVAVKTSHSDYSQLFLRNTNNCGILTKEEIAQSLSIPTSNIEQVMKEIEELCWYEITLTDSSSSRLGLNFFEMDQDRVGDEIQNYVNAAVMLEHQMSDNGEVYFCFHLPQGFLSIFHPEYPNGIRISYGNGLALKHLNKEQKAARKANAILLANNIVNKFKN